MSARYVQHDGHRWKVAGECDIDGEPGYQLVRRIPGRAEPASLVARVSECEPDTHEPTRVLKDEHAVLRFNVKRGTVTVSAPGQRKKYLTSLGGILAMCARHEVAMHAASKEFKRRVRRRA